MSYRGKFGLLAAAFLITTSIGASRALGQNQWSTPNSNSQLVPGAALLVPKAGSAGAFGQPQMVPNDANNPIYTAPATSGGASSLNQTTPGTTNGVNINPTNTSTAAIAPLSSSAAEASRVACSAACNLFDVSVTTGAAAGFFIIWNGTSAPANGAIAGGGGANQWTNCIQTPANATPSAFFGNIPGRFSTGATLLFSTTGCYNYTASATAAFTWRVVQ